MQWVILQEINKLHVMEIKYKAKSKNKTSGVEWTPI